MMEKTNKKEIALRFIPSCMLRRIDPTSYKIRHFAFSLSQKLLSGSMVLDAGAGETPFRDFFQGHHFVAIDTKWGDKTWDYSNLDILGDLTNLPFRKSSFDAVICTQVLEHVSEPKKVLHELYRALKKGGKLYLSAPQGWGVHQAPHDYFRFTCYGLKHLLEGVGFRVVSIEPSCGYFGYLANRLTVFPKALFWNIKLRWLRILVFPLEILSYFFFVLIFPMILNAMDFLDPNQHYTLNYMVKASKSDDQET